MTPVDIDTLLKADRTELMGRWCEVIGREPPSRLSQPMMAKILVTQLQWETCGQSRAALVRKLERSVSAIQSNTALVAQGQRLVREWNGRRYIVDITNDGYEWNGRAWRSLSAIAKEITGTKWSGPRFFGVAT